MGGLAVEWDVSDFKMAEHRLNNAIERGFINLPEARSAYQKGWRQIGNFVREAAAVAAPEGEHGRLKKAASLFVSVNLQKMFGVELRSGTLKSKTSRKAWHGFFSNFNLPAGRVYSGEPRWAYKSTEAAVPLAERMLTEVTETYLAPLFNSRRI